MDNDKSRELLQQLHDEISQIKSVDEKSSALLHDIDEDIRLLLERSGESGMQVHPSVVKRLETALRHFEVTHPQLTTLISKFLESLSAAGV